MSGPSNFSSLWQQEELSDVDIQFSVEGKAVHCALPAHSVILSCSPFLKAQVGLISESMWVQSRSAFHPPMYEGNMCRCLWSGGVVQCQICPIQN